MIREIRQDGVVTDCRDGKVTVRFDGMAACGPCRDGSGCGASVLARLFCNSPQTLDVEAGPEIAKGDRVAVAVPAGRLLLIAVMLYGLPVVAFLAGAWLGHAWFVGQPMADWAALALGLMGMTTSLVVVRQRLRRSELRARVIGLKGSLEPTLFARVNKVG